MKSIYLLLSSVLFLLLFSSCAINIFSVFNPANPNGVNDPNTLVEMGDMYLSELEYTNAFNCYSKAMSLAPRNSRAIDGACTAFLYMRIPETNLIIQMVSSRFSIAGMQNNLYAASSYIHTNLYKIISGQADGVIPANDVNVNLNFYFFNQLYSILFTIDTDNDGNIVNDPNDCLSIDNNLNITENPIMVNALNATNLLGTGPGPLLNPIATLKIIPVTAALNAKYIAFTNDQVQTALASNNVVNGLITSQARQEFNQIANTLGTGMNNVLNMFNSLNVTISPLTVTLLNLTNYFEITSFAWYSAATINIIDGNVINCFSGAAYPPTPAGYSEFSSDMVNSGVSDEGSLTTGMTGGVTPAGMITAINSYF